MVYIIKFFDKMYFKYLLILPLSSKKKKKRNLSVKTFGFYVIELHLFTVKSLTSLQERDGGPLALLLS